MRTNELKPNECASCLGSAQRSGISLHLATAKLGLSMLYLGAPELRGRVAAKP